MDTPQSAPARGASSLAFVSLPVALVAVAGSIWLSVGMQLKACPLCIYQRSFAMAALAILALGLLVGRQYRGVLNVLALAPAVAGLVVAAFHVNLEMTGKLECPAGIQGLGSAPQQSLAALALLVLATLVGSIADRPVLSGGALPGALVLGAALGGLSIWSAPPPVQPKAPYPGKPDICRPPYQEPAA